jgi:hypothetical protein
MQDIPDTNQNTILRKIWKSHHIRKEKCAYMERKMFIYGRELLYMHIYGRKICTFMENKKVHLWKLSSVYVHFTFRICAFTEAKMCIYGSSLPYIEVLYMHIYGSQNENIRNIECACTEDRFCICTFWLPYMCIYGRKKCAYTETKMHIYGREILYMCILASIYAHLRNPK